MIQYSDPYASHLPILRALGANLRIEHVLEFGVGQYSTLTFFDPEVFPYLRSYLGIETDDRYRTLVRDLIRSAPNLLRRRVLAWEFDREWPSVLDRDLIFIDNGVADDRGYSEDRVEVIQAISNQHLTAVVVIHDWERMAYQRAAHFEHTLVYWRALPQTAVCWNGIRDDIALALRGLIDAQMV